MFSTGHIKLSTSMLDHNNNIPYQCLASFFSVEGNYKGPHLFPLSIHSAYVSDVHFGPTVLFSPAPDYVGSL